MISDTYIEYFNDVRKEDNTEDISKDAGTPLPDTSPIKK